MLTLLFDLRSLDEHTTFEDGRGGGHTPGEGHGGGMPDPGGTPAKSVPEPSGLIGLAAISALGWLIKKKSRSAVS
ncbi:PEP-CTERM sorting domain-containing protein [Leptolyngbya sp. BC1307]|uniref:PEP-CTERM sorting domain-containing protein n=1 Tax=Leptolyngbya sp. BC1307 TaxID=2029589 RepID=UPI000EFB3B5D|nr:PEP-CTERM sorting domain-containing protein [Leptolyngbya sp. BC1307]